MKLLLCTGTYKTGVGGVASYAHDFVTAFCDRYDIVVITGDNYNIDREDKIKVINCPQGNFEFDAATRLFSIIQSESPDIIINSNYPLLSILTPFLSNEIRVISISHFVDGPLAWNAGFNGNYLDGIVSLSSYGKEYLIKKFKISERGKVSTIFNYMPSVRPTFSSKASRKVLKIVYPGGCTFFKSSEIVCHAIKLLLKTDLEFELYWLGKTALANAGLSFLKTKDVADCLPKDYRIKQIGSVSRDDSKKIIAEANIFLLPSRGEGFPITLIEAMRYGCIPIVSDAKHGSLDAITNGVNGIIVRQNSAKEIFEIIKDIIIDHKKYYSIYSNSFEYYSKFLIEDVWKVQMTNLMDISTCHFNRLDFLGITNYNKSLSAYNSLFRFYTIMDRIKYIYLFIYYRVVKYFV